MKTTCLVLGLLAVAQSVDIWTPFVDEQGVELQADGSLGAEFHVDRWGPNRGGNGGGRWRDDCSTRGGISHIQMKCGNYVGSLQMKCKNTGWLGQRGQARSSNGYRRWGSNTGTKTINGAGITSVQINAGSYVDRVEFWRGGHLLARCGKSGGGNHYRARAPISGYTLCALEGRSGWWTDKLMAGWCKPPCTWRPSGGCNKRCGGGKRKFVCGRQSRYSNCNTQRCPIDCKWKGWGSYGKCTALCDGGYQSRTRGKSGPHYGGKGCSGSSSSRKTCGTIACYKVTNCGTLAAIYAKTKGKLLGQIAQAKKNLGAFNAELKMAQDEVNDGVKLLALIKTLPSSSSKNKIKALVEKCLADARKALAALKSKIASENAKVKGSTDKVNKLEHSAAKCKCDAQARQLRPLVQRATQKIKDNRAQIDAIDKALANLYALNRTFDAQIANFAWAKSFGQGLYEMMTKTFRDLKARTTVTINAMKAKRKVMAAYNGEWDKKIAGYNKQMKDCSAKVAQLAKKLKLLLQEFGMMDIWQQIAQEYDDLSYVITEDEEEVEEAEVEEFETFATEEETEEQEEETSTSMQNVFAAVMVVGGLGAFVMGKRTSKYVEYESLV